ncbi:MAG: hypothetical protein JW953_00190 [Anaerolineae bacterium]|nr:hypothetical protein [Anaerolineae bacterium]
MNAHIKHRLVSWFTRLLNILVIVSLAWGNLLFLPPVGRAAPRQIPVEQAEVTPTPTPRPTPINTSDSGTPIYLPIILKSGSGEPTPQPPQGTEVLVKPGIGGIAAAQDDSVKATLSADSVQQDTWVRYAPLARPNITLPGLAVGGPAFSLVAWADGDGEPVTLFPPLTQTVTYQIAPGETATDTLVIPTVKLAVFYQDSDIQDLDERTLAIYTRSDPAHPWQRLSTAVDASQNRLTVEITHFSEFVVLGQLLTALPGAAAGISTQDNTGRVVLDPDHGPGDSSQGHALWEGVTYWEGPLDYQFAVEVKNRLESKCGLPVQLTRGENELPSRDHRVDVALGFQANVVTLLAFNTLLGIPWGTEFGDGGPLAYARPGSGPDQQLGNHINDQIYQHTNRQTHRGVLSYLRYPAYSRLPGDVAYSHAELLFMDHNFDWPVIHDPEGFGHIADAVYNAVILQLGLDEETCQLAPPPSPELIQRWRDLGNQNLRTYGSQYDLIYRRQHYQEFSPDPVSFSTGNHLLQLNLFRVPGRGGLDFDFTLTHNSQDGRDGIFGYSWSMPYDTRITLYRDNSVGVRHDDGRTHHYTWTGGGYAAPEGVYDTLVKTADGWQLTTPTGAVFTFKEMSRGVGRLTQLRDRRGNTLTFTYNANNEMTGVSDGAGRTATLSYTDGHVTGLTTPDGRTFGFGYTNGDLTAITDPNGGVRRYEYDARHRVTRQRDPENIEFLQNIYDDRDRVIEQTDASGTRSYFAYDSVNRVTTFTDNLGRQAKYFYDDRNRVTAIEDALGQTTRYEYDPQYNLLAVTDARGNVTQYEYDSRGNRAKRIDPLDGAADYSADVTAWEYNAQNDLVKTTDALGRVTTYDYDPNGNLIAIHAPGGRNTTFTYNSWGQPLTMTDPNNHTTTFEYDASGNLTKTTDAEGNVTTSTYDAAGRETGYTDANGHTVYFVYDGNDNITRITDPKGRHTDFGYDGNNLLIQVTDRRGGVTRYEYDENLKLVKETDPEGYAVEYGYDKMYNRAWMKDARGYITRYEYDPLYRLVKMTDANGHVVRYEYDPNSNLTAVVDPLGRRTRLSYDAVNRLKYLTDPLSGQTEYCYDAEDQLVKLFDPLRAETRYEYDGVGNLTRLIDPLGEVTTFAYDPAGNLRFVTDPNNHTREYIYDRIDRLTRELDPLGHEVQTGYDPVGNVLTLTDPNGHTTTLAYDENDNLVTITDPLGHDVSYSYDEEDNQTAAADQRGNTTSFAYNLRGLVVTVTEPGDYQTHFEHDGSANLVKTTNAKGQTTHYAYDPVGLLVKETNPLGFETNYAYDAADRLAAVTDAEGNVTAYGYDANDRLTGVTDALGGVTAYSYDKAGRLTVITDANQSVTRFAYNKRGELVKEINPLTNTWEYHYDGAGQLTMRRDAAWQPTYYDYDAAGQLVKIRYPSAIGTSGTEVSFAYDPAGNEIGMTDWNGTISHEYDELNRRVKTINFDGAALQYSYDPASNLTGLTYPNGDTVTYGYNARNLLTGLRDHFNQTTVYAYDALGAIAQITRPNGANTGYSYDDANRLTGITHQKGADNFSAFAYALDKVGNRAQIGELRAFTGSGSPVAVTTIKHYDYDALYRLTGAATDRGQDVVYAYDPVGNRLAQTGIPQAIDPTDAIQPIRPAPPITNTYTYNAANQLLAVSREQSAVSFEYDDKGNRLSETEVLTDGTTLLTSYTWDHENRLVGVTKSISDSAAITATMVATYTYDGYGRRIKKEVSNDPFTIHNSPFTINYLYNGLDPIADTETQTISGSSVTTATHYIWANGGIAEIERLPNPATGFAGDIHWTHTDGLGSLVDLTDAAGDSVTQVYYDEYGQLLTGFESLTRYSYTGQEYDAETGLYHFYARYYDAENGVWLSQDSYRGRMFEPTTLRRYVYVGDNPINYVDIYGYDRETGGDSNVDIQLPDMTQWLIDEIIRNTYITITMYNLDNLVGQAQALYFFYQQVKTGGSWDYKNNTLKQYADTGIILCGKVCANDVPGNIVYGYMGLFVGLWESILADAAGYVHIKPYVTQEDMLKLVQLNLEMPWYTSFLDDPLDQNAIKIGFKLFRKGLSKENLCEIIKSFNLRLP